MQIYILQLYCGPLDDMLCTYAVVNYCQKCLEVANLGCCTTTEASRLYMVCH
jgi:hypothetical protein